MTKNSTSYSQLKCFGIFLLLALPILLSAWFFEKSPLTFFLLNLFLGILVWTYLEYHLHRFWTHNKNGSSKEAAFRHMHHHQHPTEIKVTAVQRLVLFLISCGLVSISVVWNNYFTVFTGWAIGLAYSFFSHWMLHQSWSRTLWPHLHRFHIHHHCRYPNKCFGFTTIFWDVVFKTAPPKNAKVPERIIQFYYGNHE